MSVVKFIDAYKQSPPYQRQQAMLGAPAQINPEAPDPLVSCLSHQLDGCPQGSGPAAHVTYS